MIKTGMKAGWICVCNWGGGGGGGGGVDGRFVEGDGNTSKSACEYFLLI